MNHIYRLIWNADFGRWLVVPEIAKRHGKPSSVARVAAHRGLGALFGFLHRSPDSPPPWRWKTALCYLLALQQVMVPAVASAQGIVADGRTQTAVVTSGAVTNVTTGTVRGNNAFNSFSTFNVGQGQTANLFLPNGTLNLINLVRDQRTTIEGILNSIKDGRIGGNVYFANPHGFLISNSGVVNVGSLSLSTPTPAFVDGFFSAPGNPNDVSVASLLAGTAPRNAAATISILGQVNAIDGIALSAGAINVGGTLYSGARFIGNAPNFTDVVNANGLASATNVVVKEGRIEIVADTDVSVSGTIATPGGSGMRGGEVSIRAGGNVDLQSGALITARGNGENSAGGSVNIWADNAAVTRLGALVDASAGASGDGGAIEFSAKQTVELAGGEFRADGMGGGKAGSVLIDPWNIIVSADILRGASGYGVLPDGGSAAGANLTLLADNEITINENVTVSTRSISGSAAADHASGTGSGVSTGDSGSLTLEAGSISLKSGSKLLAGTETGSSYAGGDVLLKATRNWTGEAKISVDNATITGRNVSLTATATYNDSILTSWMPVIVPVTVSTVDVNSGIIKASGTLNIAATSLINARSDGFMPLGMITAVSAATVDVHGASKLDAVGDTKLAASSTVTSKAAPGGPNPATLPADAGVATNVIVSTARTRVGDTSAITVSSGKLDLTAKNAVTATTKADASAGGAVAIGGTLALSEVTSVTQAVIDGSATTSSTALTVGADSTSVVSTSAKAASKGAKKQTAGEKAAAPSKTEESLAKYKDQTTTADGSVDIAAAVAIANVNNITLADIESTGTQSATGAATVSSKASISSTVTADGSSAGGAVGVGAAVGVNVGVLVNLARVAGGANVSSKGLTVSAVMPAADAKNSFVTTATSGAGASNVGVAGALATNVLVNTNVAALEGDGAGIVNANGGDVLVESTNASESKATAAASVKPATATEPAAVGVGASVGINVAVNTTVAEIGDGAVVNGAKNVDIAATGNHAVTTNATGGAAGSNVAVTPLATITVAANTTTARLGTGSELGISGAFKGRADQTSTTMSTATGQTQGNSVAVGASIALNNATDTVLAEVDRDITATNGVDVNARSSATSSASATASVAGGEKTNADGKAPATPDGSGEGKSVDEKTKAQGDSAKTLGTKTTDKAATTSPTAAGLAAAAASSDPDAKNAAKSAEASSPAAAGLAVAGASNNSKSKVEKTTEAPKTEDNTESGGVAVAAAVGVNVGVATTTASVAKGRKITSANGALKVTSANATDTGAVADGSQVDAGNTSVGVGAAVALNAGISTNVAVVGDDAVVNTKGLTISAVNLTGESSDAKATAKSGAGAGNVGLAGSLAANVAINTTVAALEGDTDADGTGATVNANAGDILIEAGNKTTSTVTAGADVKGTDDKAKVGVGASIGVNVGVNTAVAEVGDKAVLSGGKDLGLNATGKHELSTDVTGGAAGASVAVTPLVAATVAVNTTTARLGEAKQDGLGKDIGIGITGKYSSTADHTASATTKATGQTKGSNVAVGASIGLTTATDTVVAGIERDVTADSGVEVNARSKATSSTTATASVAGGEKAKDDGSAPGGADQTVDKKVEGQQNKATAAGQKTAAKAPATTTPAAGKSAGDKLKDSKDNQPTPKTEDNTESGGVAVAAAVGVNVGVATTTASVAKGRKITSANGALKVTSANATDTGALADGSQVDSGNTSVGVGAAVALNAGISTNVAVVGENAEVNTVGLTISARNASGEKSDSSAKATSGAGAGEVGVAGSLAANIVVNTTVAALEGDSPSDADAKGAVVNAHSGDILIEAANATTNTVTSGADVKGTDAAAKVGVGASIGVNVAVNTIVAEAGDKSEIANGKNFGLNATADHTLKTDVTGGAAGAKVAVTPLAAVTVAVNTTTASLGESPVEATLSGKFSSTADHTSSATTTAKGQTAGSSVAVGVSLGLTTAVDTVTADVERDINATAGVEVNAKSTAKSSTSATASVSGGDKAKDDGSAPAAGGGSGSGETVDDKVAGQQNKATTAGKNTAAKAPATTPAAGGTASDKLDTNKQPPPKGETSEGGVSVAAAVGVNVGVATTTARVGKGKRITSSAGELKVTSANQTDTSASADGSQVDSAKSTNVGVGAAVALNVGVATTTAVVADEADVSTKGLTISATHIAGQTSDSAATAKSGAGAGNVGVAGSLAINAATNTTVALLEGDTDSNASVAKADANNGAVLIEAKNETTSKVNVSADVKGTDDKAKVGVGASIGVNVGVNTTIAEVGNGAQLTDAGSVGLNAKTSHAMTTDVTGGAAGAKVSITPVVAATIAVNTTVARLGEGATELDVSGVYSSSADQTSVITTKATGQAKGDVAVGASLGATIAIDNVQATVERDLDAGNGLALAAKSDTSLTTEVKAGAKGAKAAKKDKDGNETPEAGTTVDEQKKNQLDFAKTRNSATKDNAAVKTTTPEAKTPDTTEQAPGTDKPTKAPANEKQGKKVSVAAAIGATVAYNEAKAEIKAGKTVGAGSGKLKVAAESDTNYRTLATGEAVSDDVGVAAAVALTGTYNKTQATIGSGVTVSDAGDVEVAAASRQNRASAFQKTMSAEAVSGAGGGEVAVAGSLAVVGNWNETRASIDEGATIGADGAPVGDVVVSSDETSKVAAQARAGALSTGDKSKAGVGASFAVLLSYNQNTASVGYDANKNGSYAPTSLWADSLTVKATKNRVRFLTPTLDDAKNFVVNDIKNLNFDALDPSTYLGSNNYYTEAVAGAAAKGNAAVAGAFAVNLFGNTTEAYLGNAVNVTTAGKQPAGEQLGVEVAARTDTQAISFVGGVAGAKKAGVGLAATSIVSLDQTLASIGSDSVVKSNANGAGVKVSAYARQDMVNVGVAGGLATEGAGVGGVLGAIVSLARTEAKIADNAEVKSQGEIDVEATTDLTAVLVSGGVAGGKNAGVGAAIAGNVLANSTRAEIGDNAKVSAKNTVNVAADADEVAVTAVVAGAGGEKAGVAGALSANVIVGSTEAVIGQGAQINTDAAYDGGAQNVNLTARDDSVIVGIAGGGAGGGQAGVGAALDTTVLVKTVKAYVEDDTVNDGKVATVNADQNVKIDARASEVITSVSMGFAGGGKAGVGGAVSVVVSKNDVQAGIGKSATVDSSGNVLVNAQDDITSVLLSGAGAGGGNAGVGGSLAVATLLGSSKAYVGDNATVNARGNAPAATVYTGDTVITLQPDSPAMPGDLLGKKTELAKGLSVTAYNRENLVTTVVGGAGGGTAGVAATVSANVIANTTEASIGRGAKINENNAAASAEQQVRVKAIDETLLINTAGAGAGGGTAGVGAAANVGVVAKTTKAWIGQGALVNAKQAVELNAASSALTFSTTAGFAGGGSAGVGGAVAGVGVANTTEAFIEDAEDASKAAKINVSSGDLRLNANDFATSWLVTGAGAGGGAAGVGGSLSVGVNASKTKARIGNYAETNASGTTEVHADSTENVNTITIAGAGGGSAGVAGSIGVNVVVSKTEAGIGEHAKVNQSLGGANQNVDVKATDRIITVGVAGAGAGGGAAGVGGSAVATVVLNTTSAYIGSGAKVSATQDVKVAASSEKYVNSAAVAGAGGGAAGVAGAVSVLSVGSLLDGEAKSGLKTQDEKGNTVTTQSQADGQTTKSAVAYEDESGNRRSMLGESAQSKETTAVLDSNASKLAVSQHMADTTTVPLKNTQAFIGKNATVKAGQDVTVAAKDTTLAINANGAGAGGGAAGVAGSLGVTLLHSSAEAFVADGAKVDADRTLSVKAETGETVVNLGVTGYGGGAAGVGGSAAVNVVTSNTSAYIGDADINQEATASTSRSVDVSADSNSNLIAVAGSGGGAGAAAVGGVLNVNTLAKQTKAYIGEGAAVKADRNVIVDASSAQNIVSAGISIQGAGAAAVGGAATVNVVANTTEAFIGSSRDDSTKTAATVDSNGNVVVAAADDTLVVAVAGSGTGAGAAAVGGAVGANVISSQTRAYVGDNSAINARGNAAGTSVDTGTVGAAGAMPSLPSGVSGSIDADRNGTNDGNVSSGASFTIAGGSDSKGVNPSTVSDSQGSSVGSATGGLGARNKETVTGLSVTASGNQKIVSAAMGVAGAGAAGVTGTATADVIVSQTEARIGDGAQINQGGAAGTGNDVRVRAADNSLIVMTAGTVAGAGVAAVSGSANTAVIAKQTQAVIGDADVKARDVAVEAAGREDVYVVTVNASVGGAAGVGAAAGVGVIANQTQAGIKAGATLDATRDIKVRAEQDSSLDIYTVSGAGGIAGVSGAFSVGVIDNTTRAFVEDGTTLKHATLDAGRKTEISATSAEEITTGTVSAAGGGVGVAGAVGVKVVTSETTAEIGDYANVNQTRRGATQDVQVSASDSVRLKGGAGSGGFGAYGAGATADVNVVRNTTTASIGDDASVRADRDIGVSATSTKDVQSAAVAAAGGASAGIAGAVSLAFVGASIQSDSDAKSGIGNGATASAADDKMKTDGVGSKLGSSEHVQGTRTQLASRSAALGVSGDLNDATTSSRDKTRVFVGSNADIVAGGKVDVVATDRTQLKLDAVGAAGGFVGIGGAIGVGITNSTTEAFVDQSSTIDADGNVTVAASSLNVNADGSRVESKAGAGGVVGVSASVAVLKDTGTTRAYLGNNVDVVDAATLSVAATTDRKATTTTYGASVGIAAVGASVAVASFKGSTAATLGTGVNVDADAVEVSATDDSVASAYSRAGSAGIVAGSGSVASAEVTSTVSAALGSSADVSATGDIDVLATSRARTQADAIGINIGAGAVGASVATATSGAKVYASVAGNATVSGASFDLVAKRDVKGSAPTAQAHALGAAGGLLLGANGSVATAQSTGETVASVADGSTITTTGVTAVKAENTSLQSASSFGVTSGLLSLGANFSHATSDSLTQASLGDNVAVGGGGLQVSATGNDGNYSFAKAGAGGVVTAPFSAAYTKNLSRTYAFTGSGNATRKVDVGSFYLGATQTSNFNSWIQNTSASLVGVSGAQAQNTVNVDTQARLGTTAWVEADNVTMQAGNTLNKTSPGGKIPGTGYDTPDWNVVSSSGGLADVPAAKSTTSIVADALLQVGAGAHLEQNGAAGDMRLDAWSNLNATDKVKMASGGAVSAASAKSSIMEDGGNRANATVDVAPGADLLSDGDMALGARSQATVYSQAAVDVYGLVGVAPEGISIARFKGANRVEIGAAASLTSDRDIRLSAGENTSGQGSSYAATARTDVFNNTAIPVNRDPVADALIDTSSLVKTGAGSDVAASRHISLYADKGSATASGVGVGKDIYRETLAAIASAISEFFGGDPVSFETRTGRSVKSQKSEVEVDGTVRTGINRLQELEIDKNGVATVKAGDIRVVKDVDKGVANDLIERIEMLESLISDYEVSGATGQSAIAVAAYRSEINFLKNKLKAMGFTEDPAKPGFYSAPASGSSPYSLAEERLNAMQATRSGHETTKSGLETENTGYGNQITANNTTVTNNTTTINTKKGQIATNNGIIAGLDPDKDATQIANLQAQNALLKQQYEQLEADNNTINNVTNPGLQAKIDANDPKILALGTSISSLTTEINNFDLGSYSTDPFGEPTANFKSISDATAQLGNIYVRADKLIGSGALDAPGDAQIKITNNSPSYLILHNLSIASNTGGKVFYNGVDVNSNAEINNVNGGSGAAFSVTTAATQASSGNDKPKIEIISNFNPLSADYLGSTAPADRALAPDIILRGDIKNENGLVRIKSEAGSIRLEQKRDYDGNLLNPVQTASIRANEVELSTKSGDFVQSYTDSFYHVAGRGPIKLHEADPALGTLDSLSFSPEVAGSGIVANGSVFIAARYLNINGVVQSGMSEWGVSIPAAATVTVGGVSGSFADALAHYAAKSDADKAAKGAEYYAVSGATVAGLTGNKDGDWQKVDVFFNAKENRLELNGVQVQGGYIELFGQIINTNANGGELRVLDGYGKIKVENKTNLALVVNMLDSGRGAQGQISITNILGVNPDGSLNIQGGGTQVITRNGGSRDGGTYTLPAGMRYAMQVGYDNGTAEYYRYSQSGWFDIAATFTGLALDNYLLKVDPPKTNPMLRGEYLITGSAITDTNKIHDHETLTVDRKLTKGAAWKDCNWWTLCANATYYQEFTLETKTKEIDSRSVAASNPIRIKYIGYDQGNVSVDSVGSVLLAGSVSNLGGHTAITSSQGSITQKGETVQVSGTTIALDAKTGIGSAEQSLRVNARDTGRVDATTQSGDVYLRETLGDFRVGTIGGANVTNVVLEADRNMVNAGVGSWIQGQRVELLSTAGGIGADGDPLVVRSAYTSNATDWPFYGLKATARDSINLRNEKDVANAAKYSGNLLLVAAESLAGDVRIETAGSVIDNNPIASVDVRSQADLAALWDDLRLRGSKADDKADETVAAYKQGKEVNYALYWKMRGTQAGGGATYNADYQLTTAERSALAASGMTSAEIDTFEANRRTQYQQLHADVGSLTTSYQAGYSYVVSTAEDAQIRSGAKWTDAQLQLSVGAGLLKNITDTVTTIKAPNAKGRNVTLIAGENIGSYNPPVTIDLSDLDALRPEDKAALAAAERGDASVSGKFVTVVQPRPVNVAVGTGALNATAATGYALIGSEQDLRIEHVSAATDIRIKTAGGLINGAGTPGAVNIDGRHVILEAASGGIGGELDGDGNVAGPLVVSLGGEFIARAAEDVWIKTTGDLKADTVYSRGDLRLDAEGSILDAHTTESPLIPQTANINLRARNIDLNSATGSIGAQGNELDVGVNQDGFVSASAATFGKGVYLNAPVGEYFNIGALVSGDAVTLRSATDMTIDGLVTGPGPVTMQALGAMKLTPKADVHATTLGVFLRAGWLEMQDAQFMIDNGQTLDPKYVAGDAARMRVDAGTIDIQTVGDALITGIETGNPTASAIRVVSTTGRILDNGDTRLDIIADTPPAAQLTISAPLGVGANPLDVRLLNLQADSSGGVIDLAVQDSVNILAVTAGDRVLITAGGSVTGNTVTSTGAASGTDPSNPATGVTIRSSSGHVDLVSVTSPQEVNISAPVSVSVDQINVGTSLNLAGNLIDASVTATGSGPHGGSIGGFGGGPASNINLVLSSPDEFRFSNVSSMTGSIAVPQGELWVDSTYVGQRMTVSNPDTRLLIDQTSRSLQGYDVQLYTGGPVFTLGLFTNHVITDALAIGRNPTHDVISRNGDNTSSAEQGKDVFTQNRNNQDLALAAEAGVDREFDPVGFEDPAVAMVAEDENDCPEGTLNCVAK